jgi:hypothetical protein
MVEGNVSCDVTFLERSLNKESYCPSGLRMRQENLC